MTTRGIRISDAEDDVISVGLQDILAEIDNGDKLYWSILFFYGMGHLSNGKSIPEFEEEINKSKKGLLITWNDLNLFAARLWQAFDLLIIGCTNPKLITRYESDQSMFETCDIVIRMFDSCYWEVFSQDGLVSKLAAKFKEIEFLESDFLNNQTEIKDETKKYKIYAPDRPLPRNKDGVPIPGAGSK